MFKIINKLYSKCLYRKYTISFRKHTNNFKYISDSGIINVLKHLQNEYYNFEIVKLNLKDCYGQSSIVIKCKRCDSYNIFLDFCSELDTWIKDIKFRT